FGFGKTTLHKYNRLLLERLALELRERFPGLSPEQGAAAVLETLDETGNEINRAFSAEKSGIRAFGKVEDLNDQRE
ncbi:MAG: hypothetical protein WD708_06555, partial [Kiritimatiellia bacterium]